MTTMPDTPLDPAVEETVEAVAHRAARDAVKTYSRGAVVGFLLLFGGVGYAIHGKTDGPTLKAGLDNACQRVNILRAQSNVSDLVSFNILALSARREMELAEAPAAAEAGTRSIHKRSAALLAAEANKLTITGLTNCPLAVNRPKTYRFPIANPVGDANTGQTTAKVRTIISDSRELLRTNEATQARKGG
jgi:hypothetical protein